MAYALRRLRRTPYITAEKHWIFHHCLRLDMEMGVGLATGQGSDPQVMLRYSDDGGHTWSNEKWRSAGKLGEYKRRAVWNALGRSRQRIYELVISDPVKTVIIAADLNVTKGSH